VTPPKTPNIVPWRLPDHRWRRALEIVERGGYATLHRDGSMVQRTVRYLRKSYRALSSRGQRNAVKRWPDIYLAMQVSSEATYRPLEIKARVLAGENDAEIARMVGLPRPTVETYNALFLDVRDRLDATCWIKWVVIGLHHERCAGSEALMLTHAWRRGPAVIEPWLDFLKNQEDHDLGSEIGRQRAWLKLLVDTQQLPFEASVLRSLERNSPFSLGKPPKTVQTATAHGAFRQIRNQFLGQIAWNECANGGVDQPRLNKEPEHGDIRPYKEVG